MKCVYERHGYCGNAALLRTRCEPHDCDFRRPGAPIKEWPSYLDLPKGKNGQGRLPPSVNDALEDKSSHMRELLRAEREGRLVVLPCKVGDTVYVINRHLGRVFECTVLSFSVGRSSDLKNYFKTKWVGSIGNESIRKWSLRQFGRYVFLTREEAEESLQRQEET